MQDAGDVCRYNPIGIVLGFQVVPVVLIGAFGNWLSVMGVSWSVAFGIAVALGVDVLDCFVN